MEDFVDEKALLFRAALSEIIESEKTIFIEIGVYYRCSDFIPLIRLLKYVQAFV